MKHPTPHGQDYNEAPAIVVAPLPDAGFIGSIVPLLATACPRVRARALGTLHNLSTDVRSIGIVRKEVCVEKLSLVLMGRHDTLFAAG